LYKILKISKVLKGIKLVFLDFQQLSALIRRLCPLPPGDALLQGEDRGPGTQELFGRDFYQTHFQHSDEHAGRPLKIDVMDI